MTDRNVDPKKKAAYQQEELQPYGKDSSDDNVNQNHNHNTKKVSQGPNTKR